MSGAGGVDRRTVLGLLGAASVTPALPGLGGRVAPPRDERDPASGDDEAARRSNGADATLRVRAYPRLRHRADGWSGWSLANVEAYGAVGDALERVAAHVERERDDVGSVAWRIEAAPGVSLPDGLDGESVLERFREIVRDRGAERGETCHLLLWSEPLNAEVGYGLADSNVADAGGYALANVGATERWDGRAVTRNMAIHETLHTFLSDDAVGSVIGTPCDHHLGSVRHVGDGVAEVTPMATAYAGREIPGSETSWSGGGCGDHDDFFRHDGLDDVRGWRHTTELSAATREAVAESVARNRGE